ncbi:MAG: hypothetical protein OIN87_04365 [Candidatus Methanoperedens sp.]|nr:hypothetical protein [Candidatus Methanoperedens sp.]
MTHKNIEQIKDILGTNLVLIAQYNTGDLKSTLVVCNELDFDTLKKLKQLGEIPLVFTKEELTNGIDVFPIEFLNIKQHHTMLFGEDILKNFIISKSNMRQQLEFEFRSKLIHLREQYLHFKGKDIDNLILSAVPTLSPIIGGLMFLGDMEDKDDMVGLVSKKYGVDLHILEEIQDIRKGKAKFKKDKEQYIKDLIKVLHDFGKIIDEYKVK